jgi:phosphoglycolate phosphatase
MPRYVYIDLDGTLTDPFEGISNCIGYALERLGQARPADDALRRFIGPPLLATFEELLGRELAPRALGYYRERFGDIGWRENAVYPGIPAALSTITDAGHRCFVATTKPHVFARRIVEHFELAAYFTEVYGSELDGTRTDKTELLRFAQRGLSEPKESVMIGDRHYDVVGARNNGFRAIGVTWGYGTADELRGAGADCLAASPEQLPSLV